MEYGKAFGVGTTSAVILLGVRVGYGWLILGGMTFTVTGIVLIRYFFRRHKKLGDF